MFLWFLFTFLHWWCSAESVFEHNLPWTISKTAPKRYYASSPPMDRCGNGLISIFAEAIGLDLTQLSFLSSAVSSALEELPGVQEDFEAAMSELRSRIQQAPLKSQTEQSTILAPYYGLHHQVKQALKIVQKLVESPLGTALISKSIGEYIAGGNNDNLAALLSANNATRDGTQACTVGDDGTAPDGVCELNDSSNRLDLSGGVDGMPDVLTGFLTSRLMSRIFAQTFGSATWRISAGITAQSFYWDILSPMHNLGSVSCAAADYSFLTDFDHGWAQCGFIVLMAAALGCSETSGPTCTQAHKSSTPDWGNCELFSASPDEPVLLDLVDKVIAVQQGEVTPESIEKDGRVMYYMWMANLAHTSWSSSQGLCEVAPNPIQLVPGWDRVLEVWSRQEAEPTLDIVGKEAVPVVTLSRRGTTVVPYVFDPSTVADEAASSHSDDESEKSCNFLIVQRGTMNAFEWEINFDAQQTPSPGGAVHRGYKSVSDSVIPIIERWMEENVWNSGECSFEETKIHVTGHSLGGGLAEVYTAHLAEKYAPLGVQFELVTFAAAHGLDAEQAARLDELANVRSVLGELDLIPEFPCVNASGLARCDSRRTMTFRGEGQDPPYAAHINPVTISAEELGVINPGFNQNKLISVSGKVTTLNQNIKDLEYSISLPGPMNVVGWHVCAYSCWLSSRFCTNDSSLYHMCQSCNSSI